MDAELDDFSGGRRQAKALAQLGPEGWHAVIQRRWPTAFSVERFGVVERLSFTIDDILGRAISVLERWPSCDPGGVANYTSE